MLFLGQADRFSKTVRHVPRPGDAAAQRPCYTRDPLSDRHTKGPRWMPTRFWGGFANPIGSPQSAGNKVVTTFKSLDRDIFADADPGITFDRKRDLDNPAWHTGVVRVKMRGRLPGATGGAVQQRHHSLQAPRERWASN